MRIALSIAAWTVVITAISFYVLVLWPLHNPHPPLLASHGTIAVQHATIYTSPDAPPLTDATLIATDGKIAAVGTGIAVPSGAVEIPCSGCTVTAGFWNAHVHFTQPKWNGAAWKPAAALNADLADMLTSRGFTTVVDVGSDLRQTISLRRRIETGDLLGPRIYTAGGALYPDNGIPFYVKETLPKYLLFLMDQPATPQQAVKVVRRNIEEGADVVKLFTGSYVAHATIKPMRLDIATAAVTEGHRHGQLVFAHESNLEGVRIAMQSGVDILAHAPDTTDGIDDALIANMAAHMAMVPTVKMFATTVTTKPEYLDPIYAIVRKFHQDGGTLIFGTDVGYMTDYTTQGEFTGLASSGLSSTDMLRMLTTAPAAKFGVTAQTGTLAPGKAADFVVLSADPAQDVTNFSRVQTTVRNGKVVFPLR